MIFCDSKFSKILKIPFRPGDTSSLVWIFSVLFLSLVLRFANPISLLIMRKLVFNRDRLREVFQYSIVNVLLIFYWSDHSFLGVSRDSPKTLRKLYVSSKFPHQEIRWNIAILRSVFNNIFESSQKDIVKNIRRPS